jgi:hypothetical protein
MFLNIRGTFGSGKSTVISHLIQELKNRGAREEHLIEPIERLSGQKKFMAHRFSSIQGLSKSVMFMGKYGHTQCGGADGNSWKGAHEDMDAFIRKHILENHILIEGSITSGGSRYNRLGLDLQKQNIGVLYLHMGTLREECVMRVIGRRKKKYAEKFEKALTKGKELDPPKEFSRENLDKLFDVVEKQWQKTIDLGLPVRKILSSPEIGKYILTLMMADEQQPIPPEFDRVFKDHWREILA